MQFCSATMTDGSACQCTTPQPLLLAEVERYIRAYEMQHGVNTDTFTPSALATAFPRVPRFQVYHDGTDWVHNYARSCLHDVALHPAPSAFASRFEGEFTAVENTPPRPGTGSLGTLLPLTHGQPPSGRPTNRAGSRTRQRTTLRGTQPKSLQNVTFESSTITELHAQVSAQDREVRLFIDIQRTKPLPSLSDGTPPEIVFFCK